MVDSFSCPCSDSPGRKRDTDLQVRWHIHPYDLSSTCPASKPLLTGLLSNYMNMYRISDNLQAAIKLMCVTSVGVMHNVAAEAPGHLLSHAHAAAGHHCHSEEMLTPLKHK